MSLHGYKDYIGSPSILTSVINQQIVPELPATWTYLSFKQFSFFNENGCRVKINGGNEIFLRAEQGFNIDENDPPITSFIIVEDGVRYNWIAKY